jgi:hypothetical protein
MKAVLTAGIAAIAMCVAMGGAPAQAGIVTIGSVVRLDKTQAPRIVPVDWGHHHCWWIRGRRVCRK